MATKRQARALAKAVVARISTISVKEDEILLIRMPADNIDIAQMQAFRESFKKAYPGFVKRIAIIAGEIEISKVKFSDIGIDVQEGKKNELTQDGTKEQPQ